MVDLDAALEQGSNTDVVKAICHAVAIPVQVGGGIRSLEAIGAMLEQGAARAILGTAAAARTRRSSPAPWRSSRSTWSWRSTSAADT